MKATASVLIIEDHLMMREMLARVMAEEPAVGEIEGAGDCASGLALAGKLKPTLAIVDWMLPDGKGTDLVRQLRLCSSTTRCVMLSSHEQPHLVREAIDLGVAGFVMKRASTDTLRTAIRAMLADGVFYCPDSSRLLIEALCARTATLTEGERAILRSIARGENIKSIAAHQRLKPKTVHNHLANLKDKLGIRETAGLVRYAIKHGLVEAP